jgi:hypothetical protein
MVGAALGVVLVASATLAQAGTLDTLRVQVTAVRAAESGPSDPLLVSLKPRLRRLVGYRAFQIVSREERACEWRSETRFSLPGDRKLQLLPKGVEQGGDVVKLQVRLLEGKRRLVDTNVGVQNGGTMLFGVGRDPRMGDDALIIVLKAECPDGCVR